MLHHAKKVVIITEKLIADEVAALLDASGAAGYTVSLAGGKGSRDMRPTADRATVVQDFANLKFEVIVDSDTLAASIIEDVVNRYLKTYSGIAFVENVEVVRPEKFHHP
jgi:nitrogen regulatory protein PII